MQDYNKRNAIFLGVIAAAALAAFFAVVLFTYVDKSGYWSAPLPIAAVAYGIYAFLKAYLPKSK